MANNHSYKYVVVPVLANAALLKAAPGLGDLDTYIKEVTNLLVANDIPVPNLTLVYEPITPSSSSLNLDDSHETMDHSLKKKMKDESHVTMDLTLIKKIKTEKHQDESHVTMDFPLIKKFKTERHLDESHLTLKFPLINKVKIEKCQNNSHGPLDVPLIKKASPAPKSVLVPSVKASHKRKHSTIRTPNIQPCKVTF